MPYNAVSLLPCNAVSFCRKLLGWRRVASWIFVVFSRRRWESFLGKCTRPVYPTREVQNISLHGLDLGTSFWKFGTFWWLSYNLDRLKLPCSLLLYVRLYVA